MQEKKHPIDIEVILDSITDGILTVDKDWNFTYINATLQRLYGMNRETYLGRNYWDVFAKAKQLKFWDELHRAVNERKAVHFEEYSPTFHQWVSVNAYPTEDGLIVYTKDITWERKLQEQIQDNEKNLRVLINSTEDAMWFVDKNCNIVLCNEHFKKWIYNFTGKNLDIGDNVLYEGYDSSYLDKFEMCYRISLNGKSFTAIEDMKQDGKQRFISVTFNPVHDEDNNIIGVSCFSRDITEQRNHMLKIEEQNRVLKEIAVIQSHKIRGPVATILGLTQLFNRDDINDPVNSEIVEGVVDVTRELDKTIREVVEKANAINK